MVVQPKFGKKGEIRRNAINNTRIPFDYMLYPIRSDICPAAPRLNVVEQDDDCQCLLSGVQEVPEPVAET